MDDVFTQDPTVETASDTRNAEWYLQSLREMIDKMQADQKEINRLRDESRTIGARTDQIIAATWDIIAKIRETN